MRPLAENPARGQTPSRRFEELPREETGDARDPGVRRLRDDDVVLRAAEHQVRAAIAGDDARARIGEGAMVIGGKQLGGLDHLRR